MRLRLHGSDMAVPLALTQGCSACPAQGKGCLAEQERNYSESANKKQFRPDFFAE
jgi:hypothetical protein